jgi:hypothetical protein
VRCSRRCCCGRCCDAGSTSDLLYLCGLAGYLPHPLLDACTSYGTHLWLPFSQHREAWNLIAVVDPLFTLLLAVPLFLYLRRPDSQALRWGLLLGACLLRPQFRPAAARRGRGAGAGAGARAPGDAAVGQAVDGQPGAVAFAVCP